jgi:hypothetical protein
VLCGQNPHEALQAIVVSIWMNLGLGGVRLICSAFEGIGEY